MTGPARPDDPRRRTPVDEPFEERLTFSMPGLLYGRLVRAAAPGNRTLAETARHALDLGLAALEVDDDPMDRLRRGHHLDEEDTRP
jgi:hypothetical protein